MAGPTTITLSLLGRLWVVGAVTCLRLFGPRNFRTPASHLFRPGDFPTRRWLHENSSCESTPILGTSSVCRKRPQETPEEGEDDEVSIQLLDDAEVLELMLSSTPVLSQRIHEALLQQWLIFPGKALQPNVRGK